MELAIINDNVVPIDQANISAHNRGLFFGDGVYDVLRANGLKLWAVERHKERLRRSLGEMGMLDKVDLAKLWRQIQVALEKAKLDESIVYFHITRGQQLRSHDYQDDIEPDFFLTIRAAEKNYYPTITAISQADWRWKRCDIKSLNLLPNIMAKHAATKAGAYEAMLVDEGKIVTEGSCTNIFLVKDGILYTAPLSANILAGITRSYILDWAEGFGLEVKEKSFTLDQAFNADELFISGTVTQIRSIIKLDNQKIAGGESGKFAQQLQNKLQIEMQNG